MTLTPSDELAAVNNILINMGETPISSLVGDLPLDASKARDTLSEVSEEIQLVGWFWNRETLTLTPDGLGNINLPVNTLSVKPYQHSATIKYTMRNNKIYRIADGNSGDVFTDGLKVTLTSFLDFVDMPPVARRYVAVRAARVFQARELGDELLLREDSVDERTALAACRAEENENSRRNLKQSASILGITDRRYGNRYR